MTRRPAPDPRRTPYRVEVPDDTDRAYFISERTTRPMLIQGATVGPPCIRCGTRVWVAPSSRSVDLGKYRPICIECAGKDPALALTIARVARDVKRAGRVPGE